MVRLRRAVENSVAEWQVFITLTYPRVWPESPGDWKRHLRVFCRCVLRNSWDGAAVLWVLELQKRGAPHFHLLTDCAFIPKEWVALEWRRATGGIADLAAGTRTEAVYIKEKELAKERESPESIGDYLGKLGKYTAKSSQKTGLVNVGRVWGIHGCREQKSVEASTWEITRVSAAEVIETLHGFRENVAWGRAGWDLKGLENVILMHNGTRPLNAARMD